MLQGPRSTIERGRRLRREMSLPEVLLWQALQTRPGGLKFRRQHPAHRFNPDFYCHQARLVVEVDGEAHDRGDRPERDEDRDAWFRDRNIKVLRIPAKEIMQDVEVAVRAIFGAVDPPLKGEVARAARRRGIPSRARSAPSQPGTPLHQRSAGSPPPPGEDLTGGD